jgi:hypothetical protein
MAKVTPSGNDFFHYVVNKFHKHCPGLETMTSKTQQTINDLSYSTAKALHKM